MTRYNFKFTDKKPTSTEVFAEASLSELKVLVALMESGGVINEDELLAAAHVSRSRLAAAISLWSEEGVIAERDATEEDAVRSVYGNSVTEEFEEHIFKGELYEQTAKETANTIRRKKLASLFDECARLMGKHMLSPLETKRIASLCSQYGLDDEYIAVLASHLANKGTFTVNRLVNKAIKLSEDKDINTAEELERYLSDKERESADMMELRRLFGIYDRSLSSKEVGYFKKWLYEYCFGTPVIAEAYDWAVNNTSGRKYSYMDKLLTDWHSAGCKTVEACRERYEQVRAEQNRAASEKKSCAAKTQTKTERIKPAYNFDPEEAFRLALARSFPEEKNKEG